MCFELSAAVDSSIYLYGFTCVPISHAISSKYSEHNSPNPTTLTVAENMKTILTQFKAGAWECPAPPPAPRSQRAGRSHTLVTAPHTCRVRRRPRVVSTCGGRVRGGPGGRRRRRRKPHGYRPVSVTGVAADRRGAVVPSPRLSHVSEALLVVSRDPARGRAPPPPPCAAEGNNGLCRRKEPEPVHFARSRSRWDILVGAGAGIVLRSRSRHKFVRLRHLAVRCSLPAHM